MDEMTRNAPSQDDLAQLRDAIRAWVAEAEKILAGEPAELP